jgi:hypothetical protein
VSIIEVSHKVFSTSPRVAMPFCPKVARGCRYQADPATVFQHVNVVYDYQQSPFQIPEMIAQFALRFVQRNRLFLQ